jgi:hypothetical protein
MSRIATNGRNSSVTVETLRSEKWQLLEWARSQHRPDDVAAISYYLAGSIVRHFLGSNWVQLHISARTSPTNFFRNSRETEEAANVGLNRLVDLGEMMFNLQDVENFDCCISQFKDARHIEAIVADLEVGKVLRILGVPFRFVKPCGTTGTDYDLELMLANGLRAFCDTKCKLESTDVSQETVLNSLVTARKQLPKDCPGIVFLKLPESWYNPAARDLVEIAVDKFFRTTRRVIAVKIFFNIITMREEGVERSIRTKEFSNSHPDLVHHGDVRIFHGPQRGYGVSPNWIELHRI